MSFRFVGYDFDEKTGLAEFHYQSEEDVFTEKVQFDIEDVKVVNEKALDSALFLTFIVLGTSYYKVRAGREVEIPRPLDAWQAAFFSKIYQEGLSQFAFENGLNRDDLAHFEASLNAEQEIKAPEIFPENRDNLVMVSGGKDSLLALEILREKNEECEVAYITAQENYPAIVDEASDGVSPIVIRRWIDKEGLSRVGGMNGHVPVTMINEALAVVQAVLSGIGHIEFGIGEEGLEPHAWIDDLSVNHQWSKTPEAQRMMNEYVQKYIVKNMTVGSVLSQYNEFEIAELFAKKCWTKYGDKFSSCNVANYKQGADNRELKWCGKCAKCANSYLLFAPFVPYEEQLKIFGHDLFTDADLTEIYKGLLGVDGVMKPFECVASIDELRRAYREKLPGYGDLPFEV